jgi:hypothetical protein
LKYVRDSNSAVSYYLFGIEKNNQLLYVGNGDFVSGVQGQGIENTKIAMLGIRMEFDAVLSINVMKSVE